MTTKSAEEVRSVALVMPEDTNNHGTLFGGKLLEMMDKTAAIAALKFCRNPVVTASFEAIDFLRPIYQGDLVEMRARVIYTGRSSLVVQVDSYSEPPCGHKTKAKEDAKGVDHDEAKTTGWVIMVSVDEKGKPVSVPKLSVESKEEKESWERGKKIKEYRALRKATPEKAFSDKRGGS
jgi:acyl-CoA hydrolase